MKKKILYYDLDGVLADFNKGLLNAASVHQSSPFRISEEKDIDDLILKTPNFYENLPVITGAIEAVKEMMELYEVYFLSTPMWGDPRSYSAKRVWLETHFGEAAKKRLILTHRKDLIIGDYLVDDRLKHGASEFSGVHIHFGTEMFPDHKAVCKFLKLTKQ